jgi:protein-S-isoprenylcysteine O-methyltransferase Ste14
MAPERSAAVALGTLCRYCSPGCVGDFHLRGRFRTSTAVAMWAAYGLGGGLYAKALHAGTPTSAAGTAAGLAASGAGLPAVTAGMVGFGGAGQVTGTSPGQLHQAGAYRYSRDPQYAGFVLAGAGGAPARRSLAAGALAAGYAATCAWWVQVEERSLQRTFGQVYIQYKQSTLRWLGRPRHQL